MVGILRGLGGTDSRHRFRGNLVVSDATGDLLVSVQDAETTHFGHAFAISKSFAIFDSAESSFFLQFSMADARRLDDPSPPMTVAEWRSGFFVFVSFQFPPKFFTIIQNYLFQVARKSSPISPISRGGASLFVAYAIGLSRDRESAPSDRIILLEFAPDAVPLFEFIQPRTAYHVLGVEDAGEVRRIRSNGLAFFIFFPLSHSTKPAILRKVEIIVGELAHSGCASLPDVPPIRLSARQFQLLIDAAGGDRSSWPSLGSRMKDAMTFSAGGTVSVACLIASKATCSPENRVIVVADTERPELQVSVELGSTPLPLGAIPGAVVAIERASLRPSSAELWRLMATADSLITLIRAASEASFAQAVALRKTVLMT